MALVGASRFSVAIRFLDQDTQQWPTEYELDYLQAFAGQGFQFPADLSWVNRPTGTDEDDGMVMGFPRSAEPPVGGSGVWIVSES